MLFYKMWIVDREVLVLQPRHNTPRNEVEQRIIRTRLRARRSKRSNSTGQANHKQGDKQL
jgi:hypothetical protein